MSSLAFPESGRPDWSTRIAHLSRSTALARGGFGMPSRRARSRTSLAMSTLEDFRADREEGTPTAPASLRSPFPAIIGDSSESPHHQRPETSKPAQKQSQKLDEINKNSTRAKLPYCAIPSKVLYINQRPVTLPTTLPVSITEHDTEVNPKTEFTSESKIALAKGEVLL